ncbi:hypothetical protein LCGC14_0735260 [marine sediment metagenome]|uniref:Uncharacterized protein n=1 Tax=marine sediment metagenome TaxID=412755 RepID=A0A0F9STB5_9ZZZZ
MRRIIVGRTTSKHLFIRLTAASGYSIIKGELVFSLIPGDAKYLRDELDTCLRLANEEATPSNF